MSVDSLHWTELNKLCGNCGKRAGEHAGSTNPYRPDACPPPGKAFPRWNEGIERKRGKIAAGEDYDARLKSYWLASKSVFKHP